MEKRLEIPLLFVAIITAAAAERFMEGRHEREELREKLDEILRRLDERSGQ